MELMLPSLLLYGILSHCTLWTFCFPRRSVSRASPEFLCCLPMHCCAASLELPFTPTHTHSSFQITGFSVRSTCAQIHGQLYAVSVL